jgi:hypothetical protein
MSEAHATRLTAEDMRVLLARAREAGTVDRWCDLALEWMTFAQACLTASLDNGKPAQ